MPSVAAAAPCSDRERAYFFFFSGGAFGVA